MRLRADDEDDPPKYNVNIRIYVHGKSHKELLSCYRRAGSASDMNSNTSVYKVEFNATYLQPGEWYTVSVSISVSKIQRHNNISLSLTLVSTLWSSYITY